MAMKISPSRFLLTMLSTFAAVVLIHREVNADDNGVYDPGRRDMFGGEAWQVYRMSVTIKNELPDVFGVHCRSKTDYLELHYLQPRNGVYYFEFHSYVGATLLTSFILVLRCSTVGIAVGATFKEGSCIINTTSITAYQGLPMLLDYSSTKGAILAFTRGLALPLVKRGIRVNAVTPGPIWTPFIPASFPAEMTEGGKWGTEMVPMGRVGKPFECGTAYVFLASQDSSYFAGQMLHPNGGVVVNA